MSHQLCECCCTLNVSVCVKEKLSGMLVRWDCAQRNETGHPGALDQAGRGHCLTVFAEVSWRTLVCERFSWRSWKKIIKVSHLLAWSMDSSLQGVLTSWQSRDCPSASQCLSERLKEHFIQITRGDGSHIPSLPMVPTIQQNLLWFDLIWDFCCQLVCRSCYQFSIFLCNLLML